MMNNGISFDSRNELENLIRRLRNYISTQSNESTRITLGYIENFFRLQIELSRNLKSGYSFSESEINEFFKIFNLHKINFDGVIKDGLKSGSDKIKIYLISFLTNLGFISFKNDIKRYFSDVLGYLLKFFMEDNKEEIKPYIFESLGMFSTRLNTHMLDEDNAKIICINDIKYVKSFEIILLKYLLKFSKNSVENNDEESLKHSIKLLTEVIRADDENMNIYRYDKICKDPLDIKNWRLTPYSKSDPEETNKKLKSYLILKDWQRLAIFFSGYIIADKIRNGLEFKDFYKNYFEYFHGLITGDMSVQDIIGPKNLTPDYYDSFINSALRGLIEIYLFWEPWDINENKGKFLGFPLFRPESGSVLFINTYIQFWYIITLKYLINSKRREFKSLRYKDNLEDAVKYLNNYRELIMEGFEKFGFLLEDVEEEYEKDELIKYLEELNQKFGG